MSNRFRQVDRETLFLLPPSMDDWLPKEHLARFIVEIVAQLDLTAIKAAYAGRGSKAHHPETLLALLFYGYATGVFSSRKLERATYDSVAFRYIAANDHPDHDTIATFRKRFLPELTPLFVQILLIAREMGFLKLGKVSLDGTKIKANASKHRALSWKHACKLEAQLKAEVEELLRHAEEADRSDLPDGLDIPAELARREERLTAIAQAKAEIERRAAERYAEEQAAHEKKLAERQAKEQKSGKKARGKQPKPPVDGPRNKDQVNLTDEESRIMPVAGGGFEQCYNAQASVDVETMLIIEGHLSQNPNDKLEIKPAVEALDALPESLGTIDTLLADAGYYSETNVGHCLRHEILPYISDSRDTHNPTLKERFAAPGPLPEKADAVTKMRHRLKTPDGRALYAKRKCTVEPVFGIIKAVMGFRQFLLRGVECARGEWDLVCMAWNLKRLHALAA
ncbi:MAG: IS1182 family transposase [Proteobacteria bacterium]|jgi:transposase|uniref:IS1182 family transposase n=1 Tax=Desulfovermiculus halophilus TaxID=339722 RepID=UPI000481984C|nr:IS1182 family transposase [Desulfovermiculus halophilus]NCC06062.1 IS1182 family transposase [Pseudomonadota bacterium]